MADYPKTIELKEPITLKREGKEDEVITEFTVARSPKAKDLKGISMTDMKFDDSLKIISRVCNQPMHVVEEMGAVDMMAISEEINRFLPESGQ